MKKFIAELNSSKADIRVLKSKIIDGKDIKLNGESIEDLWGFQENEDFKKLMKRCTIPEDKPFILWSDKGDIVYMSFADELEDGQNLFYNHSSLGSFTTNLPNLTTAHRMFCMCDNMSFVHVDFPKLTNVVEMFYTCLKLEEFKGDLSSLEDGQYMFQNCYSMKRFDAEIPNLKGAINMFSGCALEEFKGDLTNLYVADNMFNKCKLNKESVLGIMEDINNSKTSDKICNITLGIDKSLETDEDILRAIGSFQMNGNVIQVPTGQTITNTFGNNTWNITVQWN